MVNLAASRLLGRGPSGATGEISLGTNLSFSGNVLNAASPFSVSYTSAQQTITAAGTLTLAHGLGGMPSLVQARLVCQTAELGYSVGDELIIGSHTVENSNANIGGQSIVADATNLTIRYANNANTYNLLRKDTGGNANATNANWRLVVRAWR